MAPASDRTLPHALVTPEAREAALLAPYAMHSRACRGRKYPEPEHAYRGPYQRDRDRILHSAAFRRLSGKMQVFTGEMGDYHRTRLTHTHEVASIARTMGRALRLNEDLIEALALFHDIGHPPFGHAGEAALDDCLADQGGFTHNRYALTIAEELEVRYLQFPGLNLTYEVLEGQATRVEKQPHGGRALLEVQLVDAADSITYDAHDTDDAVKLGLVSLDDLAQNSLIQDCLREASERYTALSKPMLRKAIVHELIDRQVSNVLYYSASQLLPFDLQSADAARHSSAVIGPSPELAEQKAELEAFLYERVYRHPHLVQVRKEAQNRLRTMVDGYMKRPGLLPDKFAFRADKVGLRRAVVEYVAGMTDRFCDDQYRSHFTES